MKIDARGFCGSPVLVHRLAGDGDEREFGPRRKATDSARKFQPAHSRHGEVQNHCVWRKIIQRIESIATGLHYENIVSRQLQKHPETTACVRIVINDDQTEPPSKRWRARRHGAMGGVREFCVLCEMHNPNCTIPYRANDAPWCVPDDEVMQFESLGRYGQVLSGPQHRFMPIGTFVSAPEIACSRSVASLQACCHGFHDGATTAYGVLDDPDEFGRRLARASGPTR